VAGSCEQGDEPSGSGATDIITEIVVLENKFCLSSEILSKFVEWLVSYDECCIHVRAERQR
jgi:hypothetical protein